jgi:elongation factor 1-alpha
LRLLIVFQVAVGVIKSVAKSDKAGGKVTKAAVKAGKK